MSRIFRGGIFATLVFVLFSCSSNVEEQQIQKDKVVQLEKEGFVQDKSQDDFSLINDSIRNDPNNKYLLVRRALRYISEKKEFNYALHDINKALSIDPNFSNAYFALSDVYFSTGKYKQCKNALSKYLNLNNKDQFARLRLVEVHMLLGQFAECLEEVKLCLKDDKENPKTYYLMGYACKLVGDTTASISAFKKAIEFNPDYPEAKLQLGILYSEKHNPIGSAFLDDAVRLTVNSPIAYYSRGVYLQRDGKIEEACADYSSAIAIDGKFINALYNRGYLQMTELDKFQDAVYSFSEILRYVPGNINAQYNRGRAYEALELKEKALQDYRVVLDADPNYKLAVDAYNRLLQ